MRKLLFVFGTRPEAIKLAPIIKHLQTKTLFNVVVCVTSQHKKLLHNVLDFFNIKTNYDLNIMKESQNLEDITTECLSKLKPILKKESPDCVIVQGDTSSAFSAALSAYYQEIPVAHIESGLRTGFRYSPFPEEMNRRLISQIATYHFAPTLFNEKTLNAEGIHDNVWVVGNSVIDALNYTLKELVQSPSIINNNINLDKKIILVTGHRRENAGNRFKNICNAIQKLSEEKKYSIIFPIHLNPIFKDTVSSILKENDHLKIIPPQDYPNFIWLMKQASLIISDSGGIQEEAPYLGKPVLVTREHTERKEALELHNCKLISSNPSDIVEATHQILQNKELYRKMTKPNMLYGVGDTSKKITNIFQHVLTT